VPNVEKLIHGSRFQFRIGLQPVEIRVLTTMLIVGELGKLFEIELCPRLLFLKGCRD